MHGKSYTCVPLCHVDNGVHPCTVIPEGTCNIIAVSLMVSVPSGVGTIIHARRDICSYVLHGFTITNGAWMPWRTLLCPSWLDAVWCVPYDILSWHGGHRRYF